MKREVEMGEMRPQAKGCLERPEVGRRGRKDPPLVLAWGTGGSLAQVKAIVWNRSFSWWASQCCCLHLCHEGPHVSGEEGSRILLVGEVKGHHGQMFPSSPVLSASSRSLRVCHAKPLWFSA